MSTYRWKEPDSFYSDLTFASPSNMVAVRRNPYPHVGGYLVLESDDGTENDYTSYFPILKAVSKRYSDFYPYNLAFVCCDINTGEIGQPGKLTWDQVLEMHAYGWEFTSHGRHHVGIGVHTLTKAATSGDTRIYINSPSYSPWQGIYECRIWDESNEEIVKLVDYGEDYVDLDRELQNSYAEGAQLQITAEAAYELLQGALDDLAAHGIEANHHVFTYHAGSNHLYSEDAVNWVRSIFTTARGVGGQLMGFDNDPHLLRAYTPSLTFEQIESLLTSARDGNKIMMYYGHGDAPAKLEYVASKAIELGVKIIGIRELQTLLTRVE